MRLPILASRMAASSVRTFQIREFGQKVSGTVKWFNTTKGFGFIEPADKSGDCFVHQTQIKSDGFRSLAEGEAVEFEIVISEEKGGYAFHILTLTLPLTPTLLDPIELQMFTIIEFLLHPPCTILTHSYLRTPYPTRKRFAQDVTGPGGENVQGAPRPMGGGPSRGFGGRDGPPRGRGGGGDRRSSY